VAGYSGKPLATKLDIKAAYRVQLRGVPAGFEAGLGPLPQGVQLVGSRARNVDCILLFADSVRQLADAFPRAVAILPAAGFLWVAWPKKSSGVLTDLAEQGVRAIGLGAGLVDVKVCAIDETWSGLKFVRRLKDR
jgi:hypothetical protein